MNPNLTPCPIQAHPSGIRGLVIELHQQTLAPFALIAASVLGAISLVSKDKLKMQRRPGLESPVNLYLLTLANSGDRKSTVDRLMFKAIHDFEATQVNLRPRVIASKGASK